MASIGASGTVSMFQSSPVTKDRCNMFFPNRRPAQTTLFQSSPVTKDRCNEDEEGIKKALAVVSILTGH